jgi:hypothetical protein
MTTGAEKSRRAHQITPAQPIREIEDFFPVFLCTGGALRPNKNMFSTGQPKNKKNPWG